MRRRRRILVVVVDVILLLVARCGNIDDRSIHFVDIILMLRLVHGYFSSQIVDGARCIHIYTIYETGPTITMNQQTSNDMKSITHSPSRTQRTAV